MQNIYTSDRFTKEIGRWKSDLRKVIVTTGSTNFELLSKNEFFRSFFPFVTVSDKMVINKLLGELKRLRK